MILCPFWLLKCLTKRDGIHCFHLYKHLLNLKKISSEIHNSNQRIVSLMENITFNENRLIKIEKGFSTFEKQQKSKNIILFKLEDTETINKNLFATISNIFTQDGLSIPDLAIDDIFRLGRYSGNRLVLIRFIATRWIRDVFTKINEFKKLSYIVINERPKEERELHRQLLSKVFRLKDAGHEVYMKGSRVFLNGFELSQVKLDLLLTNFGTVEAPTTQSADLTPKRRGDNTIRKRGHSSRALSLERKKLKTTTLLDNYFSPGASSQLNNSNSKKPSNSEASGMFSGI